jgi:nucleotide-binding universal stress UspA family protein
MQLEHILIAADESEAGRNAVRIGTDLAGRAGARMTALAVVPAGQSTAQAEAASAVVSGVPSVEICRFAEVDAADLVILGRKPRSQAERLMFGDTADAVARRSLVPSLHVPPETGPLRRVLVALDGSERGFVVFRAACAFAASIGADIQVVTVEPVWSNESDALAAATPMARTLALIERVKGACVVCDAQQHGSAAEPVLVARGNVVAQVQAAITNTGADLLAVGYHRGGPAGIVEGGSVARRLLHSAQCAVLAIPL